MTARSITGISFIKKCEKKGNKVLDIKGIVVALVISGIAGLGGSFFALTVTSARTEVQISGIDKNIEKLDRKIDNVSNQVREIKKDFYVPRR